MIVNKPWGHEDIWALTEKYVGKVLYIKKGMRLSLKFHKQKEFTILVLSGILDVILEEGSRREEQKVQLKEGDTYHFSPLVVHRLCASKETDVKLIEVSSSQLHDIVRLNDDHGRE